MTSITEDIQCIDRCIQELEQQIAQIKQGLLDKQLIDIIRNENNRLFTQLSKKLQSTCDISTIIHSVYGEHLEEIEFDDSEDEDNLSTTSCTNSNTSIVEKRRSGSTKRISPKRKRNSGSNGLEGIVVQDSTPVKPLKRPRGRPRKTPQILQNESPSVKRDIATRSATKKKNVIETRSRRTR